MWALELQVTHMYSLIQDLLLHLTTFRMLNLNYLLTLLNDLNVVIATVVASCLRCNSFDSSSRGILVDHKLLVLCLAR